MSSWGVGNGFRVDLLMTVWGTYGKSRKFQDLLGHWSLKTWVRDRRPKVGGATRGCSFARSLSPSTPHTEVRLQNKPLDLAHRG